MKRATKVAYWLLTLVMLAALLGACAPSQPTAAPSTGNTAPDTKAEEQVTLTYISWAGGDEQKDQEAAFAQYMEENPNVKINVQFVPYDEYHEKINTLMAANTPPDIYYINEYLAADWGEKGVAVDLKPLFEARGINMEETYIPNALFKSSGKIYGLASGVVDMNLYYNKEMFQEAGIETPSMDVNNPWTWEQYIDAAKKLTTDKDGNHPGDPNFDPKAIRTYGTKAGTFWLFLMPLLYNNDTSIFTPDGTGLALGTPEAREVLNALKDMMYVDYVAPAGAVAGTLPGEPQMFKDKQLGMVITGSWAYLSFRNEGIDVGVAPLPVFKSGNTSKTISWAAANQISAKSKNIDAATDLLIWFTNPETNPLQVKTNFPNIKAWYQAENLPKWTSGELYNEDFKKVVPQMMAEGNALIPENVYIKNFGPLMDEVVTPALDKFWLNEASLDDVLNEITQKTEGKFQGSSK
jgi:multiple sugar transport system substrate-binding protein